MQLNHIAFRLADSIAESCPFILASYLVATAGTPLRQMGSLNYHSRRVEAAKGCHGLHLPEICIV